MADLSSNEIEIAAESKVTNGGEVASVQKESPAKVLPDEVKEAMQLFASGKRNHLVRDYQSAADCLSECCAIFGKHYGEAAIECGEPLLIYGKSLLELARIESGVIEDGLKGDTSSCNSASEDDDEDEEAKDEEESGDEGEEEEEEKEENAPGEGGELKDEQKTDEPHPKEDTESIGSNEAGPSSAKEIDDKSALDQEDEDDPTNLQLAWESVELSKAIFVKHLETLPADSPLREDVESKICDAYTILGEIGIEDENFKQAIDDLTICLVRRQKSLPEDSRSIAESHYQLGAALAHDKRFPEAVDCFNNSIGVLLHRIANLKEGKISRDPGFVDDAFYSTAREIAEIEALIPEIREKIDDTNDMLIEEAKRCQEIDEQENMITKIADKEKNIQNGSTKEPAVSDINHLLKKRKKNDDPETNGSTEPSKKLHLE